MSLQKVFQNLKCKEIVDTALKTGRLSHAYIFHGEDILLIEAYLKEVATQILKIDCETQDSNKHEMTASANTHPDLMVFPKEKSGKIAVADVEEILERAYSTPIFAKNKVFVLNNIAMMNEQAQNKLLKILEEPPKNTYFIMGSSSLEAVLITIKSRTTKLEIAKFTEEQIYYFLEEEKVDENVKKFASQNCDGNYSTAKGLLIDRKGVDCFEKSMEIIKNLKSLNDIAKVSAIFEGVDEVEIINNMLSIMRDMLMIKCGNKELVSSKFKLNELDQMAREFSQLTLIESIDVLANSIMKKNFNVNKNSLVDGLLLKLLEVKYQCQL